MDKLIMDNVVDSATLKAVQEETLSMVAKYLCKSFGPMGSTSILQKDKTSYATYTKDGDTILRSINFLGILEKTIVDNLINSTSEVNKVVGDGTTSIVLLSSFLFKTLEEYLEKSTDVLPRDIVYKMQDIAKEMSDIILKRAKELTPEDVEHIAYISTNGDKVLSKSLADLYKELGNEIYVDVHSISSNESFIKKYDGMVLDEGLCDPAYINNDSKAICELYNPKIYFFMDHIDTPDMIRYFQTIINENVFKPLNTAIENNTIPEFVPTVIIAQKISSDMEEYMKQILSTMYVKNYDYKPQLLIIPEFSDKVQISDLATLCGASGMTFHKEIDPKVYREKIKNNQYPSPDNAEAIVEWCGQAEKVECDNDRTKFINPIEAVPDEDGNHSDVYNALVKFLEDAYTKAKRESDDANKRGEYRRRLQAIKGNLVDYYIGGISIIDRDNTRTLFQDAVLSCRSAAAHGYGYASNFEGFRAISEMLDKDDKSDKLKTDMMNVIRNAYLSLLNTLYSTINKNEEERKEIIEGLLKNGKPFNVVTKEYDDNVVTSIQADPTIISTAVKIISIMVTSNQYICAATSDNIYAGFLAERDKRRKQAEMNK